MREHDSDYSKLEYRFVLLNAVFEIAKYSFSMLPEKVYRGDKIYYKLHCKSPHYFDFILSHKFEDYDRYTGSMEYPETTLYLYCKVLNLTFGYIVNQFGKKEYIHGKDRLGTKHLKNKNQLYEHVNTHVKKVIESWE